MQPKSRFTAGDVVLVRVSSRPRNLLPGIPEMLDSQTQEARGQVVRFLREVMTDTIVSEAIMLASPSLSAEIAKVVADEQTRWETLRRVALSASRYVVRMRSRATPFGLMAGVALARVAEQAKLRIGEGHTKFVRPDGEWLADVIRRWELQPQAIAAVRVWIHPTCRRRGKRLILPNLETYHGDSRGDGKGHQEGSIRLTALVEYIADKCVVATPVGQLVQDLGTAFPALPAPSLWSAVRALLDNGFLISELWAAPQEADPIGKLLALKLTTTDSVAEDLLTTRSALIGYGASRIGAVPERAADIDTAMRSIGTTQDRGRRARTLQVDLKMDVELCLPGHLLRHVENAVTVLQRVTPARSRMTDLVDYQRDFVERYGLMNPVPALDVIDANRGIGVPAGFRRPPSGRIFRQPSPHPREVLAKLADAAHTALSSDNNEMELTDGLIELLDGDPEEPVWPSIDVSIRVHSKDLDAIDRGDYQISLVPDGAALLAGRMFGRFITSLGEVDRLRSMVRWHEADLSPEPVQLHYRPPEAYQFNVAHAPALHSRCLWLDGPRRPDETPLTQSPKVTYLSPDDVGLYASEKGLHAVDLADGRELRFITPHMLNPELAPNLARLLDRLEELNSRPFRMWTWRSLDVWPRLPRVRHGRTVLHPASWRALELTGRDADWTASVAQWQQRLRVPDNIVVAHHGQRLSLDLSEPGDRHLLRKQLDRDPESVLYEDLTQTIGGTDWLDRREHELTVPLFAKPGWLRSARPRIRVNGSQGRAEPTENRPEIHFPGDEWTYFRLHVSAGGTDAFLVDSLPELIQEVLRGRGRWFYIRYPVPSDHIRLRVQTDAARADLDILTEVARWGRREWKNGSLREFDVATYVPETWRYGSGPAMWSAEAVFWRDSEATLAQLSGRIARRLDISGQELAAINYLHLLESFGLPAWREQIRDHIARDRPDGVSPEQRRRLQKLVGAPGSWAQLATDAAGRDLLASWQERAVAAAAYGRQLSSQWAGDSNAVITALMSTLHMHFNRLCGVDELKERQSLSLLRELVVSQLFRK